jgi:hypothetical protein
VISPYDPHRPKGGKGEMNDSYSKTTPANHAFDVQEYSSNRSLARATQERLSKLRARYAGDLPNVLRQARKLRQQLMSEARNSERSRPS